MPTTSAENSFSGGAEQYSRARPAYADQAIDALLERLRVPGGGDVIDLGAGTGIFSRQLADRGLRVTAVDPVAAMREKIGVRAGLRVCEAAAEATGLPESSADAVFAATAWHWFDPVRAIDEVRRLLRPGAGLGLIWNVYDESVPWVAEYGEITSRRRTEGSPNARSDSWRAFFDQLAGWEPLHEERFANPWPTTAQGLVDRVLSSSAVSVLPPDERRRAQGETRQLLEAHGLSAEQPITLPYTTTIHWTRPIG